MEGDYQFDDVDNTVSAGSPMGDDAGMPVSESHSSESHASTGFSSQQSGGQGGGSYADEVFSKKISAKFRTFFIDLKQSSNGKFLKISEKSRGRKSTVMMDAEDIPVFIEALKEVQGHL